MGLANWLTLLRIVMVPVFVSLLVYRKPGPALVVFATAAFPDLLDGYIARRRGSQSRLGAVLDPMGDKLLLTASFVTLTYLKALPFWIAAVVISRDVILALCTVLIFMLGGRVPPRPTWAGTPAAAAGLVAGDHILAINGHPLRDAIDFQFHAGDERLVLEVLRDGDALALALRRRGAELGLELVAPRAAEIATCANKCVFCFIHQLPKGMRRSLY